MPLIGTALLENFALMIKHDALDLRLDFEAFWNAGENIDNGLKRFVADRSWVILSRVLMLRYRCGFSELGFLAFFSFIAAVAFILRHLVQYKDHCFHLVYY